MSKQWLEETESQIKAIQQERQVVVEEYEKLGKELAAKDAALIHWHATLDDYKKRQQIETPQPSLFLQEPNIRNLSQREVVLLVRDQNEGNIPMRQVTQAFRGIVTTPDHAASSAYTVVRRLMKQGKIVKVRPGLYRWVNGAANA